MAVWAAFISYLVKFAVFVVVAGIGIATGIRLRKRKENVN